MLRYPGTKEKSLIFEGEIDLGIISQFKYTKENAFTQTKALTIFKNSIFCKLLRDEFEKLMESGILNTIDRYREIKEFNDKIKPIELEIDLKILTFEDLQSGFVIWMVTVLVAIIVFILEKIFYNITHKPEDLTNSRVFKVKKQKLKRRNAMKQRLATT